MQMTLHPTMNSKLRSCSMLMMQICLMLPIVITLTILSPKITKRKINNQNKKRWSQLSPFSTKIKIKFQYKRNYQNLIKCLSSSKIRRNWKTSKTIELTLMTILHWLQVTLPHSTSISTSTVDPKTTFKPPRKRNWLKST